MSEDSARPRDAMSASFRWQLYTLLIAIGAGVMIGRIAAVDSVDARQLEARRLADIDDKLAAKRARLVAAGASGKSLEREMDKTREALERDARLSRPFLSANDRSRWCMIRALVEPEMRVADAPYSIDLVTRQKGWDTIDMVKHDGHLYSSKPPLFPTLVAGVYWVILNTAGLSLADDPYAVGRIILVIVNVLPMILFWVVIGRCADRFGANDWCRLFVMAAAIFGTYLTTFSVVINNHIPGAVSAAICLEALLMIAWDGKRHPVWFVLAGLFAAFAVANELPALAFAGLAGLTLLFVAPIRTLLISGPAALVVVAGFFGTNWIAHQSLRPPYAHRSETDPSDNWYDYEYERNGRTIQSYWRNRQGVDLGEADVARYAFHVLIGHHGIFSLTPIWLLAAGGILIWLVAPPDGRLRWLAAAIALLSVVVITFYIVRPQDDRNYGGMTSAFRWAFWLAPLWLVTMLPTVDKASRAAWSRTIALALLGASVASAAYPTWNPWVFPWLENFLNYLQL